MASNRWVAIDPDILIHPLVGAAQPVTPADKSRGAYSRMEAWVWIICNASFADHTIYNRGRPMTLQRGDLLGAWAFLAHTWNWSTKTVRTWVEKLMADNMLAKRASELQIEHNGVPQKQGIDSGNYYGNQSQILSVTNYWRFQFEGYELGQPEGKPEGQAKGNQRATKGQHITKVTREQGNILGGGAPKRATGGDFWKQALNPKVDEDVDFHEGKLQLLNGARSKWVTEFGGDKQLDLALLEVVRFVEPNSPRPLLAQVESSLARIIREKVDKDARYDRASGRPSKSPSSVSAAAHGRKSMSEIIREENEKLQREREAK